MSDLYVEDGSGEEVLPTPSPFLDRMYSPRHKVPPFDESAMRNDDVGIFLEACKLQPDRESLTIESARFIISMQRDRERRATSAAAAKVKRDARSKPKRRAS